MSLQTSIPEYFVARKRGAAPFEDLKKVTPSNKVLILDKNSVRVPLKLGQNVDSGPRSVICVESLPSSGKVGSTPKVTRKPPLTATRRSSSAAKQANGPGQLDIRKCLSFSKATKTEEQAKPVEVLLSTAPSVEPPTLVKTWKEEAKPVEPPEQVCPKKEEETEVATVNSKKEGNEAVDRPEPTKKYSKAADLKGRLKALKEGLDKYNKIRSRNESLAPPSADKSAEGPSKVDHRARRDKLFSSPKIEEFHTIELEVNGSPKKRSDVVDDIKKASSPSLLRKALFMSPTKVPPGTAPYISPKKLFEKPPPLSPSKPAYQRCYDLAVAGKPALPLPYKYRSLAETFRSVDTVVSMMYNRNENIGFNKLKASVQQLSKRNLTESHIGQIMAVLPDAFELTREKTRILGNKNQEYELVLQPVIQDELSKSSNTPGLKEKALMSPNVLLKRRREFYNGLLEKAKHHHEEFLRGLDPPIVISHDKLTRWHPDFDVDSSCPDIAPANLPSPPVEKLSTAKDVLNKVKDMFSTNNRMERALENMSSHTPPPQKSETAVAAAELSKALRGIPKSLLEKVRAKQAAKTAALLTRCPEETKRRLELTRLPELARILRNVFVLERKNVLPQGVVIEKVNQSFRELISQEDIVRHLSLLMKSVPGWVTEVMDGDKKYLRVVRNADFNRITSRLQELIDNNQVNL